jgi:nucleoid-associated protein YgaU
MYGGVPYSALLKYSGGTSATVEAVYGPMGKLLPDSVGLSQVELAFVAPASVVVSNVEVDGVGYAGTLEYAGGNQLRVTGIRQVTLPPTAAAAAQAAADAAMADAAKAREDAAAAAADAMEAHAMADEASATIGQLEARIKELTDGIPLGINPGLLNLESARLTIAGPNSIYISGIQYAGKDVSARVRYSQGTGTAEAVFQSTSNLVDVLDMNAAEVELVGDALVMSNVGIRGRAHTLTLTFNDEGGVDVAAQDDGWAVRTVGELRRDRLITEGTYVVNGFAGGQPLANEGAWSESGGSVVQTDSGASHAKYTIPASQSGAEILFGVTASADDGSDKVGFGLHLLASDTPASGNTWNYGRSYLIWATRDPFYDTDATHLQFYESRDNNTLTWLASRSIDQSLSSPLTLEALYQSNGMVTLLVGGEEQLSLNLGSTIDAGDRIALRSLGGPVEFTQVYVAAR